MSLLYRSFLQAAPGFVRWGCRIDTLPAWAWLALLAAALWPSWLWMGRRLLDRSDDPLGLLALAALGALAWRCGGAPTGSAARPCPAGFRGRPRSPGGKGRSRPGLR